MKSRTILASAAVFGLICLSFLLAVPSTQAQEASDQGSASRFFALTNCIHCDQYPTPEAQVRALKALGYAGVAPSGTAGIPEMLAALDKHGLKMTALYVGANLHPDKPNYDPKLPEVIQKLQGRETFIWLYVLRGKSQPASLEGDARAVAIVREVAAMCRRSGLRVALYPHAGFYVERVEDAVRVAEQVDRPNVGVTFNLCHWLKVDRPASMERLIKLARPHLFLVTINGADHHGQGWDRLIQPLDRGSFDVYGFLKTLKDSGYDGPIGLQCYGVPGDKYENLKRSIQAWRKLCGRLAKEQN